MRCSKLRYYSDLELASTSKKIDKDEFFEVPWNNNRGIPQNVRAGLEGRQSRPPKADGAKSGTPESP